MLPSKHLPERKTTAATTKILFFYYSLWFIMQAMDYWPVGKNSRLLWMLQDPVDSNKLSEHRQMITNELIDGYNEVALQVFIICKLD